MLNVLRWSASGKPAALVVICHGVGAEAAQMEVFVDAWRPALPQMAFMAPDAPEPFEYFLLGHQWFSLTDRTPTVLEAGAARAAPLLDAAIDAECTRLALPPDRVVLVGFSQGAMMVLHAGLRRRPPPLAVMAYSGAMLDTPDLARVISGRSPVLLVHGESDDVVPFQHGPQAAALLTRLGLPVQTCWCRGTGHSVDDAGLRAGLRFLQALLPSPAASPGG